jgi:hypothetical protein
MTDSFVSFFAPFVFTAVAIYLSLLLTKLNTKVKKQEVIYVWIAISIMYSLIPFVGLIIGILPYASFIVPAVVVFVFAKYYWKLNLNQAGIFALCYGVVNVACVVALGFLLSGVY